MDVAGDFASLAGNSFDRVTGIEKFGNYLGNANATPNSFENVSVTGLGAGQDYTLIYDTTTPDAGYLRLEITAVPEPSSTALIGLGEIALILHRRK